MVPSWKITALAGLVTVGGVAAQFSGLSSSCQSAAGGFLLGDLGKCLSLTSLVPVLTGSGSLASSIDGYLNSICTSAPCSNQTISSAKSTVDTSCSSDLQNGTTLVVALDTLLSNYTVIREAACLKDTANNTYCVTETLSAIQNATGTEITVSYLTSLLGGSSSQLDQLAGLDSSVLCTPCTEAIYQEALQANATLADTSLGKSVTSKCGAEFGTGSTPSGISGPSAAASSSAPASTGSSASGGVAVVGLSSSHAAIAGAGIAGVVMGIGSVLF